MKIKHAGLAVVLLGFVSGAYAVAPGLYIGAQAGQTNQHNEVKDVQTLTTPATVATSPSNTGFGGRAFLGYNYNPNFAVEGGLTYYAPSTYKPSVTPTCGASNPQIKEAAFDLVGKGIFQVDKFGVFGKGGVAVVRQTESQRLQSTTTSTCGDSNNNTTSTSVRPTATVGVSYDLNQNWVADLSASRVFAGGNVKNADLFALGISYHFVDRYCGQFLC